MISKTCTKCNHKSYSESNRDGWICPNCKEDLTHVKQESINIKNYNWRKN